MPCSLFCPVQGQGASSCAPLHYQGQLDQTRRDKKATEFQPAWPFTHSTRSLTGGFAVQEHLVSLFEGQGMTCQVVHMVQRCITNRASGAEMHRRWLQATFVKGPLPTASALEVRPGLWLAVAECSWYVGRCKATWQQKAAD